HGHSPREKGLGFYQLRIHCTEPCAVAAMFKPHAVLRTNTANDKANKDYPTPCGAVLPSRRPSQDFASVPIPKFASLCCTLVCELPNRRTLSRVLMNRPPRSIADKAVVQWRGSSGVLRVTCASDASIPDMRGMDVITSPSQTGVMKYIRKGTVSRRQT